MSPPLLDSLTTAQEVLAAWSEPLKPIELDAGRGAPEPGGDRGTAAFFSAGVDSFYTAVRRRGEIDGLVHVHGFDTPHDDVPMRATMSRAINAAARELDRPLIEVETNLRATSDRFVRWGMYHGAFLGSVGQLLAPGFSRLFVPATFSYRDLVPRGLHALLDPRWSTEARTSSRPTSAGRIRGCAACSVPCCGGASCTGS